jgi:hypothetical protein
VLILDFPVSSFPQIAATSGPLAAFFKILIFFYVVLQKSLPRELLPQKGGFNEDQAAICWKSPGFFKETMAQIIPAGPLGNSVVLRHE